MCHGGSQQERSGRLPASCSKAFVNRKAIVCPWTVNVPEAWNVEIGFRFESVTWPRRRTSR